MSIGSVTSKLKEYFNNDDKEQLLKYQDHLQKRLTSLLEQSTKMLRLAIDKSAEDMWRERIMDDEQLQDKDLYTAR